MGFPTLKKFLCCLELEVGGMIIGWFNIVVSVLALLGVIIMLSLTVLGYDTLGTSQTGIVGTFITIVVVYSFLILYYGIVLMASAMLVKGVRSRDNQKMVLFMIFMAVGVFFQFINFLIAGWATFWWGLFWACLSFYWFLCIYSLHDKIRKEKMGQAYQA